MTESFNDLCPYMLNAGMPYELFWEGELSALNLYLKAWERKSRERAEHTDTNAWMIGSYVQIAVASTLNNKNKYPQQPRMIGKFKTQEEKNVETYEKLKRFSSGLKKQG